MLYLIGSIILTSYLTLSFKVLERLKIPPLQAIVFNYWTCVATGCTVSGSVPFTAELFDAPWLPWAGLMGLCFVTLFNVIGYSAQKIGVAVTSVANKLSLVIPFLFSLHFYDEESTGIKVAGVVLALAAVVLTCFPRKGTADETKLDDLEKHRPAHSLLWLLPAILFFGSGLLDTLVKYVEQRFLDEGNNNAYLISAFGSAATLGLLLLLGLVVTGRQ
ncbi:MAG TPA: hypothetical protein VHK69_12175, partial [Chitinophagaceae bacterium]|nr:hypothetical protein [Chitinophagaceae bacterium]